jgi:hypothetical protein
MQTYVLDLIASNFEDLVDQFHSFLIGKLQAHVQAINTSCNKNNSSKYNQHHTPVLRRRFSQSLLTTIRRSLCLRRDPLGASEA